MGKEKQDSWLTRGIPGANNLNQNPSMNKQEELAILQKAASDLGRDSYLGPWLASIIDELGRDLESDFVPVITLAEARQRAEYVAAKSRNEAEAHFKKVGLEADQVLRVALREVEAVKSIARRALEAAIKTI